jgi:hypothetical protein
LLTLKLVVKFLSASRRAWVPLGGVESSLRPKNAGLVKRDESECRDLVHSMKDGRRTAWVIVVVKVQLGDLLGDGDGTDVAVP